MLSALEFHENVLHAAVLNRVCHLVNVICVNNLEFVVIVMHSSVLLLGASDILGVTQ